MGGMDMGQHHGGDMGGMDMGHDHGGGMDMGHDHGGGMGGMDMGGMGGMDMGSCKTNMLGNWDTINTCFLTSSWLNSTQAKFAGSCVGVAFWVMLTELIRRFARDFDRFIVESAKREIRELQAQRPPEFAAYEAEKADMEQSSGNSFPSNIIASILGLPRPLRTPSTIRVHPNLWQQCVRAVLYAAQFTSAYLIMLIAMSFNGYMLLSIILGAMIGYFVASWDTLGSVSAGTASCCAPDSGNTQFTMEAAHPGATTMVFGDDGR